MKYILLSILILNTSFLFAQGDNKNETYVLTYFVNLDEQSRVAYLMLDKNEGLYYSKKEQENSNNLYSEEYTDDGFNYNVKIVSEDTIFNVVKTNLITNEMLSSVRVFKDGEYRKYLVSEKPNTIEWEFSNETKVINGLNCQKAETRFKGRRYEVWYTEEIPTSLGPWKLHGLPGAVVLASDSENYIQLSLAKIDKIKDNEILNYNFDNGIERITYEDYLLLKKQQGEEVANKIQSKLPRGVQFNITNITNNWLEKDCN